MHDSVSMRKRCPHAQLAVVCLPQYVGVLASRYACQCRGRRRCPPGRVGSSMLARVRGQDAPGQSCQLPQQCSRYACQSMRKRCPWAELLSWHSGAVGMLASATVCMLASAEYEQEDAPRQSCQVGCSAISLSRSAAGHTRGATHLSRPSHIHLTIIILVLLMIITFHLTILSRSS